LSNYYVCTSTNRPPSFPHIRAHPASHNAHPQHKLNDAAFSQLIAPKLYYSFIAALLQLTAPKDFDCCQYNKSQIILKHLI